MFINKIFAICVIISFITIAAVNAEEVFVDTKTNEYHKISCRLIRHRGDLKETEKTDALKMGFLPDKECYLEDAKIERGKEVKTVVEKVGVK